MKVLHFHFGKDGGAEGFFVHLVNALARRGVEQKVIIRPKRRWRADIEQVADVAVESHFRSASLDRLTVPLRVKSILKKWQPDAVFAWMSRAGHLLPTTCNCPRFVRLGDYPDRLTQFKHADTLICNTPGIAEHVRKVGWTRGVEVVTNFTNTEQVTPIDRAELDTPNDVPLITSIGRLVPRKGFDVLIRSLKHVPTAHLWIVGDGQEYANLQELAKQENVKSRVRFAGWKGDPRPYVAAADISAMASNHEPLGNVILEGWAQQVPVVAARSEGPTWLVQHNENGILVEIGDDAGFAAAFNKLLTDRTLANTIVAGGTESLQGRFSETAVLDRYLQVLFNKSVTKAA